MTFSAQRNIDAKTSASIFTDQLTRVMAGTGSCANALGVSTGAVSLNATPADIQFVEPDGHVIGAGTLVAKNLQVESIQVREDTSVPDQPGPGGIGNRRRAGILAIKLKNLSDTAIALHVREIPFRTVTNPARQIVSCSMENSEVQACEAGGGTWDPDTDPLKTPEGQRCRPPAQTCQYGGSFSLAPVGGYRNPFTNTNGCQPGFTQQQSGQISNVVTNSKESFTTTHYPVFTCMRCNVDLAASAAGNTTTNMDFSALVAEGLAAGSLQDQINMNGFFFFNGFL